MELLEFALKNRRDISMFRDNSIFYQYVLLTILSGSPEPMGSWAIQEELEKLGIEISSPSVGRYLKTLDNRQYTRKESNKGRVLEKKGREALKQFEVSLTNELFQSSVRSATKVTDVQRLIEVYTVRKAIEVEAVKLCVKNMTPEQYKRLELSIQDYKTRAIKGENFLDPSLDFHSIIAEGSGNSIMKAMIDLLLNSQKQLEGKMDELETRQPERGLQSSDEHKLISQAIFERNAELAAERMSSHMQKLIDVLQKET